MNFPQRQWRLLLVAVLGVAAAECGRAAEAPPADQIVPMAPLTVTDSRVAEAPKLDEQWLYGRIGEFEVLSTASRRATEDYMRRFYRFHQLFTELFPQMNAVRGGAPTLVFCGGYDAFATIQPKRTEDSRKLNMSFYGRDADLAYIVLDLQAEGALIENTTGLSSDVGANLLGSDSGGFEREPVDADLQVKREYVRYVLSQGARRPPAWLAEGLAQLLSIVEVDGTTLRFGRLRRELIGSAMAIPGDETMKTLGSMESVDALALYFNRQGFIPFPKFFATTQDDEDARNIVGGRFGMQALAFVHFCLYAQDGKRQQAFTTFVSRLGERDFSEALFQECFGKTCQQVQNDLRGYLQGARYRTAAMKNYKQPDLPPLELRAAEPVEWLRAKADAQRFAGRTADAAVTLQTAIANGFADPRLYASVGFLQRARGNDAEAQAAFRNAVTAKVALPGPYIATAAARLETASAANNDSLAKADFVAIMRLLMAARERMQAPRRDVYELIARTWLRAPVPPKNENLAVLEEGVLAFPSDVPLVLDTATLKQRIGRNTDAFELAQLGLRVAVDDATRSRFAAIAEATKAAAPAPAPAR